MLEVDYPFNLGLQIDGEGERSEQVCELMRTAIRDLADADEARVHELAADFAGIYLNHSFGVSPCESVWFDEDGLVYQEPMFQAREIYRHYGLEADDWRRRSEDHLVLQLLFVSHLMNVESENALRDAATFLDEHTLRWVDKFAERVATRCDTQFYAGLALLTSAYLNQLRDCLADDILHEPRPTAEEVERALSLPHGTPTARRVGLWLRATRHQPSRQRRRTETRSETISMKCVTKVTRFLLCVVLSALVLATQFANADETTAINAQTKSQLLRAAQYAAGAAESFTAATRQSQANRAAAKKQAADQLKQRSHEVEQISKAVAELKKAAESARKEHEAAEIAAKEMVTAQTAAVKAAQEAQTQSAEPSDEAKTARKKAEETAKAADTAIEHARKFEEALAFNARRQPATREAQWSRKRRCVCNKSKCSKAE